MRRRARHFGLPYNVAQFVGNTVGNVTFSFSDASHATFSYTVDGITTQSKAVGASRRSRAMRRVNGDACGSQSHVGALAVSRRAFPGDFLPDCLR